MARRNSKLPLTGLSLLIAPFLLGGCCYFAPCHFGTHMAGTVTDAESHRPIPGAAVRLYHYEARTAQSGCFALGGADALPFEFGVSAPGYRPVVMKAVPGVYSATVALAPEHGIGASHVETSEISRERYGELSRSCQ
jgi:hypothetical protein